MSLLIYHPAAPAQKPPQELSCGRVITLSSAASRHIQVLRKQPGDTIQLFDGRGTVHTATIQEMGRRSVAATVVFTRCCPPPAPHITLMVGLTAGNRMEWLLEKATELGASCIQPVLLQRSVARLPALTGNGSEDSRSAKKRRQWEQVATAACEQSGRTWLPVIAPVRTLEQAVQSLHEHTPHDLAATGSTTAAPQANHTVYGFKSHRKGVDNASGTAAPMRCLLSLHSDSQPISDIITAGTERFVFASAGEGGFTANEEKLLLQDGYLRTSLGTAVLRAETAPIAAICMAHALSSAHRR